MGSIKTTVISCAGKGESSNWSKKRGRSGVWKKDPKKF